MMPLPRDVIRRMSVIPARTASSIEYCIWGRSTTGIISFGRAFVAGRNRVPNPAAGITAFVTRTRYYPLRGSRVDPCSVSEGLGEAETGAALAGNPEAVSPFLLRLVESAIRRPDQRLEVRPLGGEGRHADRYGHTHRGFAPRPERLRPNRLEDLLGSCGGTRRARLRQDADKLFASIPSERVNFAESLVNPLSELDQDRVAALVPERVVDVLELVEVEHEHAELALESHGRRENLTELHLEVTTVPHPREAVRQREALCVLVQHHVLDRDASLLGEEDYGLAVTMRERSPAPVHRQHAGHTILGVERSGDDVRIGGFTMGSPQAGGSVRRHGHGACPLCDVADDAPAHLDAGRHEIVEAPAHRGHQLFACGCERPKDRRVGPDRVRGRVHDRLAYLGHVVGGPQGLAYTTHRELQLCP